MSYPQPVTARVTEGALREYWLARAAQHTTDTYAGVPLFKFPEDLRTYEHLLWADRSDTVIEIGTSAGGSALWFRDRLDERAPLRTHRARAARRQRRRLARLAREHLAPPILTTSGDQAHRGRHPRSGDVDAVAALIPAAPLPRRRGLRAQVRHHDGRAPGLRSVRAAGGFFVVEDGCVDVEELRLEDDWPRGVLAALDEWLETRRAAVRRPARPRAVRHLMPSRGLSPAHVSTGAAITVEGVSKTFRLPHQRYSTLKERALHPFRSRAIDELRALQDVSFDGREAASSSASSAATGAARARCSSAWPGSTRPTAATMEVDGELSPFIELGVGFNAELTARDNVLINAIMLGLSRARGARAVRRHHRVRRARGVRRPQAQELLVGHARAAGVRRRDPGGRRRAAHRRGAGGRRRRLPAEVLRPVPPAQGEGRTIVFVTHDMDAVERFCDRAMLLERGTVVDDRRPARRSRSAYNEINFGRLVHDRSRAPATATQAGRDHRALGSRTRAVSESTALAQGEPVQVVIEVRFRGTLDEPVFGFTLRNEAGHTVFATRPTTAADADRRASRPATSAIVRVALDNWLAPGAYRFTPVARAHRRGTEAIDAARGPDRADRARHAQRRRRWSTCRTHRGRARERRWSSRASAPQRRRAPLLGAHLDARGDRLEAALLRVRARLRRGRSRARSLFFGVIYVVFTEIANVGDGIKDSASASSSRWCCSSSSPRRRRVL